MNLHFPLSGQFLHILQLTATAAIQVNYISKPLPSSIQPSFYPWYWFSFPLHYHLSSRLALGPKQTWWGKTEEIFGPPPLPSRKNTLWTRLTKAFSLPTIMRQKTFIFFLLRAARYMGENTHKTWANKFVLLANNLFKIWDLLTLHCHQRCLLLHQAHDFPNLDRITAI